MKPTIIYGALVLLLSLASCGQKQAEDKTPAQETYSEPAPQRSNVQVQVDVNKGAAVQIQKGNVQIEVDKHHKHKH